MAVEGNPQSTATSQKALPQASNTVTRSLVDAALKYLQRNDSQSVTFNQPLYKRYAPFHGIDSLVVSPVKQILAESSTVAAHLYLQRQWRKQVALTVGRDVCIQSNQRRQADIAWKQRLIACGVQQFWHSTARESIWPADVGAFRAVYIEPEQQTTPSPARTPSNKRLRSPVAPKRGEKRRRKASLPAPTVDAITGKTVSVGMATVAFGTSRNVPDCQVQTTSQVPGDVVNYARAFLRSIVSMVVDLDDASMISDPSTRPHIPAKQSKPPMVLRNKTICLSMSKEECPMSQWPIEKPTYKLIRGPSVETTQLFETYRPHTASNGRHVSVDTLCHLSGNTCKQEHLARPINFSSHLKLVQPWEESESKVLIAAMLNLKPEFFAAFRVLSRLEKVSKLVTVTLAEADRERLTQYVVLQHKHRTVDDESLSNLDEPLPINCSAINEFVAHTLLKSGQPEEWIKRHRALPLTFSKSNTGLAASDIPDFNLELSCELIHFLARRKIKDKRRGRMPTDRRNPFVLEHALQTDAFTDSNRDTAECRRSSLQQQAVKFKTVADSLPPWAVIYRLTASPNLDATDVWEWAAPMLTICNTVGGAIVGAGSRHVDPLKRFLPSDTVPRPMLFSRLVRSLQATPTDPPPEGSTGALAARVAKLRLTNPSQADLAVLASDQLCMPVSVSIKAAQRVVRKLAIAWDPVEEMHLWEAVMHCGNVRVSSDRWQYSFRDVVAEVRRQVSEAVLTSKYVESSSFVRQVDWQLVAFWLNSSLSPFDRARSCNECKSKFISLLVEYAAGLFPPNDLITVKPGSCEIDIEEPSIPPSPTTFTLVIPRTDLSVLPSLLEDLDFDPGDCNLPCAEKTGEVQARIPSRPSRGYSIPPTSSDPASQAVLDLLAQVDAVSLPTLKQISLKINDSQEPFSQETSTDELLAAISAIDQIPTSPMVVESIDKGLQVVSSFLQASKLRTHFETQGLVSTSVWVNLQNSQGRTEKLKDQKVYERWSKVLAGGVLVSQLQRLAKCMAISHDFTEKRRRTQQGGAWLQESFVADRTLRLHIQSSQGCLSVLQSLRDRLKSRQPGQEVPSQTVYNAALRSYHRLILPPHDSQISAAAHGQMLAKNIGNVSQPDKLATSSSMMNPYDQCSEMVDWRSCVAALIAITRATNLQIKNKSNTSAARILSQLYTACPANPPDQTRSLDMSKTKFPTLRLIPTAVVRAQMVAAKPPEEANAGGIFSPPRRPFTGNWRSASTPEVTQKRSSHNRPVVNKSRRSGASPQARQPRPLEQQWPPPVDYARPPQYAPQAFMPPQHYQGWPPRPYTPAAYPEWPPQYMQKSPAFPISAYTAAAPPRQYFRPPEDPNWRPV